MIQLTRSLAAASARFVPACLSRRARGAWHRGGCRVDMSAAGSYAVAERVQAPSPRPSRPTARPQDERPRRREAPTGGRIRAGVAVGRGRDRPLRLSVAGITRRRVGWVVARRSCPPGSSSSSPARPARPRPHRIGPTRSRRDNAALAAEVAALKRELEIIQRPEYVAQQAHELSASGSRQEIPFTLDPSVPEPGPDAPGSASLRVGATEDATDARWSRGSRCSSARRTSWPTGQASFDRPGSTAQDRYPGASRARALRVRTACVVRRRRSERALRRGTAGRRLKGSGRCSRSRSKTWSSSSARSSAAGCC